MSASEWENVVLSDVLDLQRGHDLPAPSRKAGNVPIVGSFGVTGWHDVARYEGPGVAVGRSGASFGTASYVEGPYWPLNTVLFVTDFKANNARWVYWLLHLIDFAAFNSGSAQPSLNRNFLRGIPVRRPPIEEQSRIAEALGALDELISVNQLLVKKLWESAEALYRRGQEASLTRMPLSSLVDLRYGVSLPASKRRPGPFAVVRSAGIIGFHNEALVQGPGIVIGRKGSVGSVTWVHSDFTAIDTAFHVETRGVPMLWVYFLLRSLPLRGMNTDSAVPGLNRSNVLALEVARPDDTVIREFQESAHPLVEAAHLLTSEIQEMTRTRDELLPLLMSGAIRVKPS